jgi:hypothetical protein
MPLPPSLTLLRLQRPPLLMLLRPSDRDGALKKTRFGGFFFFCKHPQAQQVWLFK